MGKNLSRPACAMTLAQTCNGCEYRVSTIRNADYREQIMRMGLSEGSRIRCVTNIRKGPVVVRYGRTDLAIGRGMAEGILVEQLAPVVGGSASGSSVEGEKHGILSPDAWRARWRGSTK